MSIVRGSRQPLQLKDSHPTHTALRSVADYRRAQKREARLAMEDLGPVVYYVWRKGLIKIGYSTNLGNRLSQLGVPRKCILALESGSHKLEARRHRQFYLARQEGEGLGVEHFWPSPELIAHINGLREPMGLPELVVGLRPVRHAA